MKPLKNDGVGSGLKSQTGGDAATVKKTEATGAPPAVGVAKESENVRQRNTDGYRAHTPETKAAATSTSSVSTEVVDLTPEQRGTAAKVKGTCPFIGSAMASGALPIRNSADKPLATIEDVVKLGNSGGGDLGNVLRLFATGNHALMAGDSGKLDTEVPPGTFSLDLPGSQGSHPGHSGIMQGNPLVLNSGRFSEEDFARLISRAKDGYVKRSDVAKFIAENVMRDPSSKVFGPRTLGKLGLDALKLVGATGPAIVEGLANVFRKNDTHEAGRDAVEAFTKMLGEENLAGSAGEFALLFAFLANKPGAKEIDGEPALSVEDLTLMFKEQKFPEGWETWPKNASDWVKNSAALTLEAGKAYLALKHEKGDGLFS